jgi:hypothetical protein
VTPRSAVAVLFIALTTACGTPRAIRLDTGHGAPLEHRPPASSRSIQVDTTEFETALAQWVLELPLELRSAQRGWLVRASYPAPGEEARWQRLMRKSFGGLCPPGERSDSCLSLLDDMMGMSQWDKLGVALALSFEPLKESIARAVEDTLAPQLFYTVVATGLITWAVLAANPEPVFTKAAALISALMLIYLGGETFLELVEASRELKWATDRATTPQELEHASQRFARRVGPEVARIVVLAVTVAVSQGTIGGAALLASRLPMLPHFPQAAALGASQVGLNLANVGQVSAVAVVGGTIVISLPATAVAMAVSGAAAGSSSAGFRSWGSFSGLKSALGSAGPGKNWHHIVEQTPSNIERFGAPAIHNTENVIAVDEGIHRQISAYYSSKDPLFSGAQTVRQWLSGQSLQAQREFGLKILRVYGVVP